VASTTRIVLFWNPSTVNVVLFKFSAQVVHVLITCLESYYSFTASFVYGFNTISLWRSLWDDLQRWIPNSPWLVLGDFNSRINIIELMFPTVRLQTLGIVGLTWVLLI